MIFSVSVFGQVNPAQGGLFSQTYSKEISEYRIKEFIVKEVLQVPDKRTIEVDINSLTTSKSVELTTVIYDCAALNKQELIFSFWNEYTNQYNVNYTGYAFKNFDFEKAKELLDDLDRVQEEKSAILKLVNNEYLDKNAVYKFEDIKFIFYTDELGSNLIRVLWNGFDSEWNQPNMKTMKKRFNRYFNLKK